MAGALPVGWDSKNMEENQFKVQSGTVVGFEL